MAISFALSFIEKAKEIAIPQSNRHNAMLEYIQAFYDCFVSNNYDAAIDRLSAALQAMDKDLYDTVGYKLLMTLGNSHQLKGDLFSAQESYLAGLKSLSFKRQDLSYVEKLFFAAFYYNLATLLSNSELKIESADYLQEAIRIYDEVGNKFKLSQCYVAYAQMEEQKKEYNSAIDYLNRALQIGKEINDEYIMALAMANLGVTSIKANQPANALVHFNSALSYYESHRMLYETAMIKFEMAKAHFDTANPDLAMLFATQAEELMLDLENKKELSEIYRLKAAIFNSHQAYKQANEYLEKYIESLKYFYDNEKTNALARAKKEFESERKENEARILREMNEEIKRYANRLEASNNELKQFASVASHDLKEPLRMISSYIYLLKKSIDKKATEQELEFCNYALDGAKRMEAMIQDLLRLARVDADAKTERINLNDVITEVQLNLRTLIKEQNAVVNCSQLPVIMADKTQMLQLFQNLIANGINYNENGSPQIKISCTKTGEELEITVEDNGIGIPDNFKESAFRIFKTMANKSQTKGTGIGLAICKKIVEKMNGQIIITDAPTGGTIFRITFSKNLLAV
jgi:signal transduction histidine kinase